MSKTEDFIERATNVVSTTRNKAREILAKYERWLRFLHSGGASFELAGLILLKHGKEMGKTAIAAAEAPGYDTPDPRFAALVQKLQEAEQMANLALTKPSDLFHALAGHDDDDVDEEDEDADYITEESEDDESEEDDEETYAANISSKCGLATRANREASDGLEVVYDRLCRVAEQVEAFPITAATSYQLSMLTRADLEEYFPAFRDADSADA